MEKRFFTILLLPSNPSRVRKFILSQFFVKSLAISALLLIAASAVVFLDYVSVKKKEIDLTSLREKTRVQDVQLQTFADKINDLEGELARLRNLGGKIELLTNTKDEGAKAKRGRLSLGGKGGPEPAPMSFNETSLRDLMSRIDRLNAGIKEQEVSLSKLHASLEHKRLRSAATPSLWPVRGYISSFFGDRESPFDGGQEFHEGIDIAASSGAPVVAAADGMVTLADRRYGLGNAVTIDHGYGYVSRYGHLSRVTAGAGQRVKKGQTIGTVGSTGRSTGPHLHYEVVVNGSKVDPLRFLN